MGVALKRKAGGIFNFDGPTLYDQTNFAQLTFDPAKVIAGLLQNRKYSEQEGAEFDDSSWIAEQKAVQHDWPAVELFLAESPAGDVTTTFDTSGLAGLRALEDGKPSLAAADYAAADRLWRGSATLQAFFPDFECNVGRAYAANGQFDVAWPFFHTMRHVRCRAFWADALDASGDWATARQAYRSAEATAPDLALAYEREGLAYLRHGDPATAIARESLAHEKSPHWADPLKDWGDALVAMHRSGDALARYREAVRWAPRWQQLQQAIAAAQK
jgi:hypothetical protein